MTNSTTASLEIDAGGKRERTKAANRVAILDAARRVFAELGFEATTVRDIIRGTELASGTFYNYFKSKEEVFDALSRESVRKFQPLLREVKDSANNLESYIRGAIHAYFKFLAAYGTDGAAVSSPHFLGGDTLRIDTPEMQAVFNEIRRDLEEYLVEQNIMSIDSIYLTAAAVGLAREVGDRMMTRHENVSDEEVEQAAQFASDLLISGLHNLVIAQKN
jgi:Transcriptional regulator